MLDHARLDVVGVGPEYGDHARVVLEALRRGIHVFVEKPVATTLAGRPISFFMRAISPSMSET